MEFKSFNHNLRILKIKHDDLNNPIWMTTTRDREDLIEKGLLTLSIELDENITVLNDDSIEYATYQLNSDDIKNVLMIKYSQ